MNKDCPFVFLPTDKESNIYSDQNGKMNYVPDGEVVFLGTHSRFQHLYILSDDEIKKSNWFYSSAGFEKPLIEQAVVNLPATQHIKKIIVTTNPELDWKSLNDVYKISQSNIEYLISLYNGKEKIDIKKLGEKSSLKNNYTPIVIEGEIFIEGYGNGYKQCLQDNADKKFTLEDIKKIIEIFETGWVNKLNPDLDKVIESMTKEQPKRDTVTVEYEKVEWSMNISPTLVGTIQPKLKDGNIIIVR